MYLKKVKSTDIPKMYIFHWEDHRQKDKDSQYPAADLYLQCVMTSQRIREMIIYMYDVKDVSLSDMSMYIQGNKTLRGSLSLIKNGKRKVVKKETRYNYYIKLRDCYIDNVAKVVHFEQFDRKNILSWVKIHELHFDVQLDEWDICFENTEKAKDYDQSKVKCVNYDAKTAAGYGKDGLLLEWKGKIYGHKYTGNKMTMESVGDGIIGEI